MSRAFYIDGNEVPIIKDLDIAISKLIANVREPDTRDTDFSNTTEFPGVGNVDQVFEYAFEANIAHNYFNPNLKTSFSYREDGIEIIGGYLKLTRMRINREKGYVIYECETKGHFSDLFFKINEKYLTDLSFSEYNHNLTRVNVENSWTTSNIVSGAPVALVAGLGYRYGLADYGVNGGHLFEFPVKGFRPALFAYEYLLKIFYAAGKTFTSTFLSGTFFKSNVVPCTEIIKSSDTSIANRSFYVGQKTTQQTITWPLTVSGSFPTYSWNSAVTEGGIKFNTNNSTPYTDPSGQYNPATGEFTLLQANTYTIRFGCQIQSNTVISTPGYSVVYSDKDVRCRLEQYIAGVWTTVIDSQVRIIASSNEVDEFFAFEFTQAFNALDTFRVVLRFHVTNYDIQDGGGNDLSSGTVNVVFNTDYYGHTNNPYLTVTTPDNSIQEGDGLVVNSCIPKNILQKDFLKGIMNLYNLYAEIDKDNPNNYIIEPRHDFIQAANYATPTTFYNWTDKLDISKEIITEPSAAKDMKGMDFTYKPDGDYYNKSYQDQYTLPYGTKQVRSENQFNTAIKKIELCFSPTPLAGNATNSLIIPKIYKNENGVVSQTKANIRILLWNPTPVSMLWGNWTLKSSSGDISKTEYPYMGHLDHPYAPTIDLCFDSPIITYYDIISPIVSTGNDIYEIYYKAMFLGLVNKDSKTMTAYFALNSLDIKYFTFRKKIFIENAFYVANSINDFKVLSNETTQVELLKLE